MIIRSTNPQSNFVIISKTVTENDKLSWAARGLLVFLLGKPSNWKISIEHLALQTKNSAKYSGKDSIYSLLQELMTQKYVIRSDKQSHDENGRLCGYDYVVYDSPQQDSPYKAEPYKAEPYKANPPLISNELEQGMNKTSNELEQGMNNINSADAQKTKKLGLKDLLALNIDKQYAQDWLEVRKVKRAALTQSAINLLIKEALIAKISVNDAVRICAENAWQGFKAEWFFKLNNNQSSYQQKKEFDRRANNQAAVDEFLRGFGGDAIDGECRHV